MDKEQKGKMMDCGRWCLSDGQRTERQDDGLVTGVCQMDKAEQEGEWMRGRWGPRGQNK